MLGALFGDIVGSRFTSQNVEGDPWKSMDFPLFTSKSVPTATSVLICAVADALLQGMYFQEALLEWGWHYPNAGYGGSFFRWLKEPRPYNSWSNGSAMRASPIGWARSGPALLEEAKKSAEISHNHPYGIQGAQAVAEAIHLAPKLSKSELRQRLSDTYDYDLYRNTTLIRPDYRLSLECRLSVPEAIICALEATSVEEAVRLAVSLGGDSGVLASIAGAIAEARFGFPTELRAPALERLDPKMTQLFLDFEDRYLRVD